MKASLGVDLGGTWLRLCLAAPGRKLKRRRLPRVHWRELAKTLKRLRLGRLDRLVAGSTGVWAAKDKKALARSLRGLAREVEALSDVELAHRAALGGKPGIVILAGTGSVAFGRAASGKAARAGGWGPLLGDEGSAFWIGREALKRPALAKGLPDPLSIAHSAAPIRRTAALAARVLKAAKRNSAAKKLRREAAEHLAELAVELKGRLKLSAGVAVSWRGGLFDDDAFLADFRRALARKGRFAVQAPLLDADVAAAQL